MLRMKKSICIALLIVGIGGSWYVWGNLVQILNEWRDQVHGPVIERSLRAIPRDKLETLPKETLLSLVVAGQGERVLEFRFHQAGYNYLSYATVIAAISNLVLTVGTLCGLLMWRTPRRSAGTGAPGGEPS